jgi:hypothetical protein
MAASPLNIQGHLQVKALLSVAFAITGSGFSLFCERNAHRAAPIFLQFVEFVHKKLYLPKLLDCILICIKFLHTIKLHGKNLPKV